MRDYFNWPRTQGGQTRTVAKYITSALTDEARDWINRQRKPWFLWLAHVAPHLPLHLPPKNLHGRFELNGSVADRRARALEYYFAALEALDAETGRLLAQMPKAVRDNTVVIFLGDNGTPRLVTQGFPRRRSKGSIFEGGTHVPMVVSGKGVIRRGARDASLINTTDVFATIAELAGVDPAKTKMPEDSVSFAGLLSGTRRVQRQFAYVEHFGPLDAPGPPNARRRVRAIDFYGWAIRDERWKFVQTQRGRAFFYDLERDPLEQHDLLIAGPKLPANALSALVRLKSRAQSLRQGL